MLDDIILRRGDITLNRGDITSKARWYHILLMNTCSKTAPHTRHSRREEGDEGREGGGKGAGGGEA